VRIEYGQNVVEHDVSKIMEAKNVFYSSELPVFLARSAKHNTDVYREGKLDKRGMKELVDMKEVLAARRGGRKRQVTVVPIVHKGETHDIDLQKNMLEPMEDITSHLGFHEELKKGLEKAAAEKLAIKQSKVLVVEGIGDNRAGEQNTLTNRDYIHANDIDNKPGQFRSEMAANILTTRKQSNPENGDIDRITSEEAEYFTQAIVETAWKNNEPIRIKAAEAARKAKEAQDMESLESAAGWAIGDDKIENSDLFKEYLKIMAKKVFNDLDRMNYYVEVLEDAGKKLENIPKDKEALRSDAVMEILKRAIGEAEDISNAGTTKTLETAAAKADGPPSDTSTIGTETFAGREEKRKIKEIVFPELNDKWIFSIAYLFLLNNALTKLYK
jgi:hypothetical protein